MRMRLPPAPNFKTPRTDPVAPAESSSTSETTRSITPCDCDAVQHRLRLVHDVRRPRHRSEQERAGGGVVVRVPEVEPVGRLGHAVAQSAGAGGAEGDLARTVTAERVLDQPLVAAASDSRQERERELGPVDCGTRIERHEAVVRHTSALGDLAAGGQAGQTAPVGEPRAAELEADHARKLAAALQRDPRRRPADGDGGMTPRVLEEGPSRGLVREMPTPGALHADPRRPRSADLERNRAGGEIRPDAAGHSHAPVARINDGDAPV